MNDSNFSKTVGILGLLIAVAALLFGDNILGIINSADQPYWANSIKNQPHIENIKEAHNKNLINKICNNRNLVVTFYYLGEHNLDFLRLSGSTVVPISSCDSKSEKFYTNGIKYFKFLSWAVGYSTKDTLNFLFYPENGTHCNVKVSSRNISQSKNYTKLSGIIYCDNRWKYSSTRATVYVY